MKLEDIRPFVRCVARRRLVRDYPAFTRAQDCRLYYAQAGGMVYFDDLCGQRFETGGVILIPPGQRFALTASGKEASVIEACFDYTFDYAAEEMPLPTYQDAGRSPERVHESVDFEEAPCLNAPLVRPGTKEIERALLGMMSCYEKKKRGWRLRLNADFVGVLLELLDQENQKSCEQIDRVIELVQRDYMTPLSNAQIAAKLGYHPNYVNALFLKHMGVTIHQYLLRYRVEQAIRLLSTTNLPISDIAKQSGFKYFSHFSQCFRQLTGYTPGVYRSERGR